MSLTQLELQQIYEPSVYDQGVPFDVLQRCQAEGPVVWVDEQVTQNWPGGKGFWFVTHHKEVMQVLKTPKLFSSWLGGTQMRDPASPGDLDYIRRMMLNMDPPEHSRLRRLLVNSFTPTAIRQLQQKIEHNAELILDRLISDYANGECNFTLDIAAEMPLMSLADMLGMPSEDRYLMFDWANRVIGFQDPEYASSDKFDVEQGSAIAREALSLRPHADINGRMPDPRTREGMPDLYHYAHLLAEQKRREPQDDIVSILLKQVDDEGGVMGLDEFENMFWLFAVAGNETLRNGIPGGMIALLEHPQAMQACQQNPTLLETAVDEMLRWWTPVMNFRRTVTQDTEFGGQSMRAGDKIIVSFTAANRDPKVFENPEAFDIYRQSNPHLAFGYGPHFCLGAELARMQMRTLFTQIFKRLDNIQLAGKPTFLRSNFQRGVKNLPITFSIK